MYHSLLANLVIVGTVLAGAFAAWKGDPPARIAGVVSAVNAVALPASRIYLQQHIGEAVQLTADFIWAIGLLLLVVRYASLWLGVTMLLQAVQFSLHAYYLVNELPIDRLHAWVNNLDTTGISVCILIGTVLAIRQRGIEAREEAELEARRKQRSSVAA